MNIIKQLKASECIRAVKSNRIERLGQLLYEFVHDPNGYKLIYSKQEIPSDIKIYIKLLFNYAEEFTIAIISFHDPEED